MHNPAAIAIQLSEVSQELGHRIQEREAIADRISELVELQKKLLTDLTHGGRDPEPELAAQRSIRLNTFVPAPPSSIQNQKSKIQTPPQSPIAGYDAEFARLTAAGLAEDEARIIARKRSIEALPALRDDDDLPEAPVEAAPIDPVKAEAVAAQRRANVKNLRITGGGPDQSGTVGGFGVTPRAQMLQEE